MKKLFNKTLFCLIIGFLSFKTTMINAQNEQIKKDKKAVEKYLKVFLETNYDVSKSTTSAPFVTYSNQSKSLKIFPSFAFTKIHPKGRLFELSFALQDLEMKDDKSTIQNDTLNTNIPWRGTKTFLLAIGSRIESAWRINQVGNSLIYLGISTNPTFLYNNNLPYTTATFPSHQYVLTAGLSVVPRWILNLNDRFLIDINMPLTFLQGEISTSYYGNPVLPTYARTINEAKIDFLFKPQFKVGFGIKI